MKRIPVVILSVILLSSTFIVHSQSQGAADQDAQQINALIEEGQYDQALDLINEKQAGGEVQPALDLLQGAVLVRKGELEGAMKIFKDLAAKYPNDAAIYNNMGVIFAEQGEMESARKAFEKALQISPDYEQALYNLGDVYAELTCRTFNKIASPRTGLIPTFCQRESMPASRSQASASSSSEEKAVLDSVEAWRQNWSAQNVQGYLSSYSNDFSQPGKQHKAWVKWRTRALSRPSWIKVELTNKQIRLNRDHAKVRFVQSYTASNYHDVVNKELTLAKSGDNWKIIAEVVR